MRKIGKLNLFLWILLALWFTNQTTVAQDIQVSANISETNIFEGEQVKLSLTVSGTSMGSLDDPILPEMDGLRWLRGSTSKSSKFSILNGSPSVSYTFGYILIAQEPGTYTVPPIEVSVDGNTYRTDPIDFKILDPATLESGDAERSPDIFLRMEPTTDNPVVGQQVVVDVMLYFKNAVEVSSYQPTPGWKAEGFWKEELEYPQRAQTTSTIVNGTRYQRARLLQYALFPTKSGELTLSPFEVTVSVRQRRSSTDPFGFGLGQERMSVQSIPVNIDVDPLPELDNAQFIGAVGSFEISRSIEPRKALVGESVEITTRVEGSGNLTLVNKPEYDIPESLEKYNPQESSNINRVNREITGTRVFTDIVIARNEGDFEIPAARVAYFDPQRKRYVVKRLPALSFTAERDPNAVAVTPTDLRFDIQPITGLANWSTAANPPIYQLRWVWALIFLPLLMTGGVYAYKQYHDRMNSDTAFARSRTALDKAQQTLKQAEQTDDIKNGYHLIEKTLMQFISDKMNLPPAGLSHQDVLDTMKIKADREVLSELKRLLTKCETIAYAPQVTEEALKSDIEKTSTLIKKIGKLA